MAVARPGWADAFIDALATPGVALLLLFIGIAAAQYAELHAPGIGVGGFVAGLCFLLFFWSKYLDGTAGWLEVLLFAAGLLSLLLEILLSSPRHRDLRPGRRAANHHLAGPKPAKTFVFPHNDYQFRQFRDTLLGLGGVGVGVIVAAQRSCARFLPRAAAFSATWFCASPPPRPRWNTSPIANRWSTSPICWARPVSRPLPWRPAGKARFGDQLVACAPRGRESPVDRGVNVTVIEIHGNRIVVRPTA